jgi:hypothetical protein
MMKNSLRALLGVSALALLLTATPVFAAQSVDVSGENVETGANSDNVNRFDIDNDGDVRVDNTGNVNNSATADVDTGGNDQNRNTTSGDLETGSVDASTEWENVVNEGAGLCGCPDGEVEIDADFRNELTGFNSDNRNILDVDMDGDMRVENLANIANSLGLTANTGGNDQNQNTTAGDMTTGDVTLTSEIMNRANSSDDSSGGSGGGLSINVEASNETTGANSDNVNRVDVDADGNTRVNNRANISNSVRVDANTGGNDQNRNTTAGSMTTGNIEVSTEIENVANSGGCACPPARDLEVNADLSNDTTGSQSDNRNVVDVNAGGNTTVNNTANVSNSLGVDADTGNNDQNQNTSGGDMTTGDVEINFGVSNTVN